jgi:predicted nucleotide-binding protein
MAWTQEGDWYVLKQKTRKPFVHFKSDATKGLFMGLAGFFTTHRWEGNTCYIEAIGADGHLVFDNGEVTCKVRFTAPPAVFLQGVILSQVENTTTLVCEAVASDNKNVFIVHGHNLERRDELRDFLRDKLHLQPIILEECDDRGKTIIEKFEYYAPSCSFAFVLMTPDDMAASKARPESRLRARQNVILELGWFIGYLGRDRVVILSQGGLEIPSDIHGVVDIRFEKTISEVTEKIRQRLSGVELV